eukprot:4038340-Amphidinium_carterae.1
MPKPSPATYLASSSALEQLLECAHERGDPQAKALAEQVDKERKATVKADAPGEPVAAKDKPAPLTQAQATGLRDGDRAASPTRANSPARGSPLETEQGTLEGLREPAELPAVPESEDEEMPE